MPEYFFKILTYGRCSFVFWWKVCRLLSGGWQPCRRGNVRAGTGLWWSHLFVPIWTKPCWGADPFSVPVTVMMHVLPVSLQTDPPDAPPPPPLSVTSLYHLFWLPSILSPHLFLYTFLCFVHCPPSLQLCLSRSNPVHCSPRDSHFRFGDALWPHTLSAPPALPPADRDPKSSCSSLDWSPWKFFWWLITVASKPHTKSQHECYCRAHNGIQAVMAISKKGFGLWTAFSCV